MRPVTVIGVGVSGLSSAILLQQAGYTVTIVSKELLHETTSAVAAAFWYPYLCNPKNKAVLWSRKTLEYLKTMVLLDAASGCTTRVMTELFDRPMPEPWWKDAVPDFRQPSAKDLPKDYVDGYQLQVVVMDSSKYLAWLYNKFIELGGLFKKREVNCFAELLEATDIVVNCAGLGSRTLASDSEVYPVRGQVLRLKGTPIPCIYADDDAHNSLSYVVPRLEDTILGGTAQKDNWNLQPSESDTKGILERVGNVVPEINKGEILEVRVGLRPCRFEVRLETESVGKDKLIVHNYGHGGAGYTLSWGCAAEVVERVQVAQQME